MTKSKIRQLVTERAFGCCEYCMSQDKWIEHFEWNDHFTIIIGITPTGRATVKALQLNRDRLINQRIIYRAYGVHPPKQSLA